MNFKKSSLLTFSSLSLMATVMATANAATESQMDISVLGALTITGYNLTPAATEVTGISGGGGALFGFNFMKGPNAVGIELGAFYVNRQLTDSQPGTVFSNTTVSTTANLQFFEVPLMFRFTPSILIVEFGGYMGVNTGISGSQTTTSNSTGQSFTLSITSSQTFNVDFGLKAGLGVLIPVSEMIRIRVQGLGALGLANLVPNGNSNLSAYSRYIDVLAGVTIAL